MLRTVGDQPSLWERLLPPEVLGLSPELARVDKLLDDPRFFEPFRAHFDPVLGRPSVPIEVYLRLMFLKNRYRLGYETLCAEVADSISWQRFCRIPLGGRVPHPTTLMKITTRCGSETVDALNETLIAKAVEAHLVRTNRVRADTTVVEADVTYPTDSSLLTKAVGRASRLVERIQRAGAATRTTVVDHVAEARRGAHSIGVWLRRRSGEARDEVLKITGEIAGLAESAMADAARVVLNARRHLQRHPDTPKAGRLAATVDELDTSSSGSGESSTRPGSVSLVRSRRERPGLCRFMTPTLDRSERAGSANRSSSATRPRSSTTTTESSWTTPSRLVIRWMRRCWPRPSNASLDDVAGRPIRSPPIGATARPAWTAASSTTLVSAMLPSPGQGHHDQAAR